MKNSLFELFEMSDEQIEELLMNLIEEEKNDTIKELIHILKKSLELSFMYDDAKDNIIEALDLETERKDIIIEDLLNRLNSEKIDVLNKEDIIRVFGWEDQKARAFLRMAVQMKYATKINKNIIITKENFEKYLEFLRGKDLSI
ncbi:hypothetical protein [uncultured Clostridium sp.]|uniref:hypothetical protein n=1 Tax=uncultured Clostridium sp. TaxID=59620 RepID=UPI00262E4B43|nr:hypothetical protein [uncultured Clostridium sp.]